MTDLISNLSDVMRAEIKNLEVIANNTANANTPGYRAEYAALKNVNFLTQIQSSEGIGLNKLNPIDQYSSAAITQKSVQQNDGAIKATGISSHLALRGKAWFVVQKDDHYYLTRNGMFKIDSDGSLRTTSGEQVMGQSGPIVGLQEKFKITSQGKIIQSQKETNQLRVVSSSQEATLLQKSNGLYETSGELVDADPEKYSVISGAYEISNTDTATDMIRLMQTTRHIETIQRSISAYDQLLNVGINQIGK